MRQSNTSANLGFEAKPWQATDTLRDTLLSKLVTGELRVKNREGLVEAHA